MEYIQAGQMIREFRKRKGLSQEQLCEGLCEPPTISKIEKGRQYPNKKLLDALLVRLQEHLELQVPLSPADFERARIERELLSRTSNHDYDVLELAERYRSCSPSMNKHEEQFYLFARAIYLAGTARNWAAALERLEQAILLTLPKYRMGSDISSIMLTSMEFSILNNIAICQWFLMRRNEAILLMGQLYEVLSSRDIDGEEYAKRLPMTAYNLSMWLGLRQEYERSLSVAEEGIRCCIKYGKHASLADLLYNKGFTLIKLGREAEGTTVLKKSFMLMYATENVRSYNAFREDLTGAFGDGLWDRIRENTLPTVFDY